MMLPRANLLIFFYVSAYLLIVPAGIAQDNPTQADLDELQDSITEIQSQIASTRRTRNNVEAEIETRERQIAALVTQIAGLESRISEAQSRLSMLEDQQEELNTQRQNQQVLVRDYIQAAYQNGQEEYLKLLLNQENIAQSARILRYYRYFSQARNDKIAEFEDILLEIAANSVEIQETAASLRAQQQTLQSQRNLLEDEQLERQQLIAELESDLASSNNELSRLEVQYEEMAVLIEELARAILDIPLGNQAEAFADLRGALPWPLNGNLLNRFGTPYAVGDLTWEGVIIGADPGTDVRAVHHGRVVYADWFSSSGLLLIIDHGGGYMTLYAHNQSLYKEVGDWVLAGETIAAVGNTGGRSDFGVYFEIRYNGDAQNPDSWLVER
ncbi:MAG: hypothetical protein CMP91_09750 [Gammaproteobacteria bacterium]|nr:hypothetical protein [Gammaproteobacteria bacterium]|tara:strand:- start:11178 stop:12332 length:1155 start_codon:yes stop_codon:yes gene_type:complete